VARALLERFTQLGGSGVAAPSANRFGKVSPTQAGHVLDDLGVHSPLILDGGPCEVGVESTIVDLTRETARLLRPGRIRREAIEQVLGAPLADRDAQAPRASGTLAAHYSPRAPLELIDAAALAARLADCAKAGLRIGLWSSESPATGPGASLVQWIAAPAQAAVWEADLYDALRRFDAANVDRIIVVRPPASPDWEAVRDRLTRAAAASQGV
jgi:L-threonylcarbamoyladenylate synthase